MPPANPTGTVPAGPEENSSLTFALRLRDEDGYSPGSKYTQLAADYLALIVWVEQMRSRTDARIAEMFHGWQEGPRAAAVSSPATTDELQRAKDALAATGIAGIMDEFRDLPDAIEQMALHIKELEERASFPLLAFNSPDAPSPAPEGSAPMPIDTGDVVTHGPTGETWTVAYVEGDHLAWMGWPEGEAEVSDCTLVEKATPETRRAILEQLAAVDSRTDRRVRYARQCLSSSASTPETTSDG